jgi:hypothetical protein
LPFFTQTRLRHHSGNRCEHAVEITGLASLHNDLALFLLQMFAGIRLQEVSNRFQSRILPVARGL